MKYLFITFIFLLTQVAFSQVNGIKITEGSDTTNVELPTIEKPKRVIKWSHSAICPPQFEFADMDKDGEITLQEINFIINNYVENDSEYELKTIAKLIVYFNQNKPDEEITFRMKSLLNQVFIDSLKKTNGPTYIRQDFEHKLDKYITISSQLTSIEQFQSALPNAKYNGDVSISNKKDKQNLSIATLNMLFNFWETGDILICPEMQIGNGIGNGAGMGAYPNALFAFPQPSPYMLRAQFRQHFYAADSTRKFKEFQFTIGRYILQEMFDGNPYSGDPKRDFLNFSHTMLAAWDAATTAYGYTHGAACSFIFENSSLNFSANTHNQDAGGITTDWNIAKAHSFNLQYAKNFKLFGKDGKVRLLGFYNSYHGGSFSKFYADSAGHNAQYDSAHAYTNKLGAGIDINYDLTENSGLFLRYSLDDGKHEDFGYTQCDGSLNGGAYLGMKKIKRPLDRLGLCASINTLSNAQQNFMKAGGTGFMIGDGNMNYAPETAFETFYSFNFFHHLYLTLDYQYVMNVGYNKDRGNAHFFALRFNMDL